MPSTAREFKGESCLMFPTNYVVIDLETTGLDPYYDAIIEMCALRYENGMKVAQYSSLVNPGFEINEFIEELTGITNDMLSTAPQLSSVLPEFLDFVGASTVVGHNVNFDINFIYDHSIALLNKPFTNEFVDTLRLCRRMMPERKSNKLGCVAADLCLKNIPTHRSVSDCLCTNELLHYLQDVAESKNLDVSTLAKQHSKWIRAKDIKAGDVEPDEDNPLFGKLCVFTGKLERFPRKVAMQFVVDIGGSVGDKVTKDTNFLILGNNDYCSSIKDGKSSKQKKAEKYQLEGQDILTISESTFYSMIGIVD